MFVRSHAADDSLSIGPFYMQATPGTQLHAANRAAKVDRLLRNSSNGAFHYKISSTYGVSDAYPYQLEGGRAIHTRSCSLLAEAKLPLRDRRIYIYISQEKKFPGGQIRRG